LTTPVPGDDLAAPGAILSRGGPPAPLGIDGAADLIQACEDIFTDAGDAAAWHTLVMLAHTSHADTDLLGLAFDVDHAQRVYCTAWWGTTFSWRSYFPDASCRDQAIEMAAADRMHAITVLVHGEAATIRRAA
jgi:hypothetical protein